MKIYTATTKIGAKKLLKIWGIRIKRDRLSKNDPLALEPQGFQRFLSSSPGELIWGVLVHQVNLL
jgi:hypothetical protein